MLTDYEIIGAFVRSVHLAQAEQPQVGVSSAHEWAMVGRVAIQMARQAEIVELEANGIYVDIEYGQMSVEELKKVGGRDVRIDMILHRRGCNDQNLLAIEFKMKGGRKPNSVSKKDDDNLKELTAAFGYRLGLSVYLPRRADERKRGWYAIYRNGERGAFQQL